MKSKLCTLLLIIFSVFVWITAAQATPAFLITTTDNPINITPGGTATITYTVQNTSGIDMPQMKYFPPALTTITGGTCSNSLAKNASCTVILLLTIPATTPVGTLKLGSLGVCGFNGRICSVPYFNQRVTVNVIPVAIELVSIAITPTSATIAVGSTQQYTAIGHFSDGSTQDITSSVTWHSSNTAAATIVSGGSLSGLATGVAPGTTMITATQGLITSNSATLTVVTPTLVSIAITPTSATIAVSGTQQYTAIGTFDVGPTQDITATVTWHSSNTAVATITPGPGGGLATGVTPGTTMITATQGLITSNSATLTVVTSSFAYMANEGNNTVNACLIAGDGTFSTCNPTGSGFDEPFGVAINSAGTFAYVSNTGFMDATVSFCAVSSGTLSSCTATGNGFAEPIAVGLNPANTIAYIVNFAPASVSFCPINGDGSFGTCNTTGSGFSSPRGIAINPANTFAYITNDGNSTVSLCSISGVDGSFTTCTTTGSGFNGLSGITINSAGTRAYIANTQTNSVLVCPINPVDGTLGTCATAASGFLFSPLYIALNSANTQAYVTLGNFNQVQVCPINGDGTFGTCVVAGSTGFNNVQGIAIH